MDKEERKEILLEIRDKIIDAIKNDEAISIDFLVDSFSFKRDIMVILSKHFSDNLLI